SDVADHGDAPQALLQHGASRDRRLGDHHVVVWMENDRLVAEVVGRHLRILSPSGRSAPARPCTGSLYHTRQRRRSRAPLAGTPATDGSTPRGGPAVPLQSSQPSRQSASASGASSVTW